MHIRQYFKKYQVVSWAVFL